MPKGATLLSGLRDIRSMHSTKKRSIPRMQSSVHLELYMLHKEKDRLEKELCILDKRKKSIRGRIGEIGSEMDKLQKAEETRNPRIGRIGKTLGKDWKRLPISY